MITRLEWIIADGTTFSLSPYIHALADAERIYFAGCVGAGVTDLIMNALGYVWRDNAACLATSLDPHADFIYGGGPVSGHGVVLAEAHGSFAASVTSTVITSKAKRKYREQVKPYVAKTSPHGKVIHGYSIAIGSKPGSVGAFLSVSEKLISKRRGTQGPSAPSPTRQPENVLTSVALTTHRSNFTLMSAPLVVGWIDWIRERGERHDDISPVHFIQLSYDGRSFLACVDDAWLFDRFLFWPDALWHERWVRRRFRDRQQPRWDERDEFAGWFVMEANAAAQFLNSLSAMIRGGRDGIPAEIELLSTETVGFASDQEARGDLPSAREYTYALYRDGLALLGTPPSPRTFVPRRWSPTGGMDAD